MQERWWDGGIGEVDGPGNRFEILSLGGDFEAGRRMSGRHSRASISQDLWGFAQVKITVFGGG